jgi:hypothetical protein
MMTTGREHLRTVEISIPTVEGAEERRSVVKCRCALGADHDASDLLITQYDPNEENEEDGEGEALSVYAAADIWRSKGEDPDYSFGFDEDELRRAAED